MRNIGIAIIDDESLVRLGIKSSVAWEEYGYEIVGEADNGQTGLEMIREKHPDIVLLDVCMPVMNGIEVLKSLQKLKIQCKVIILSCHDDFCFVKEAMKNGAFDYLRKNRDQQREHPDGSGGGTALTVQKAGRGAGRLGQLRASCLPAPSDHRQQRTC